MMCQGVHKQTSSKHTSKQVPKNLVLCDTFRVFAGSNLTLIFRMTGSGKCGKRGAEAFSVITSSTVPKRI